LLVACSSSSSSSAPIVGVDDVAKACAITSAWKNTSAQPCTTCTSFAQAPQCACDSDKPYDGQCADQARTASHEPTCAGVDTCIQACAKGDCACVDGCYAGKPACRSAASARDGCLAQVCDAYCR
jgi:hypothetical protein